MRERRRRKGKGEDWGENTHDILGSGGFDAKTGQFICGKREGTESVGVHAGTPSARCAEGPSECHLGERRVTH